MTTIFWEELTPLQTSYPSPKLYKACVATTDNRAAYSALKLGGYLGEYHIYITSRPGDYTEENDGYYSKLNHVLGA